MHSPYSINLSFSLLPFLQASSKHKKAKEKKNEQQKKQKSREGDHSFCVLSTNSIKSFCCSFSQLCKETRTNQTETAFGIFLDIIFIEQYFL